MDDDEALARGKAAADRFTAAAQKLRTDPGVSPGELEIVAGNILGMTEPHHPSQEDHAAWDDPGRPETGFDPARTLGVVETASTTVTRKLPIPASATAISVHFGSLS